MEMKKSLGLLGMFLFGLFLISFVSADVSVTYQVNYGVVGDNGAVTKTTIPVNGFEVSDSVCSSFTPVSTLTGSSSSNQITLTFPQNLVGDSYTLYFNKSGHIGWEQSGITWNGNGVVNNNQLVYLSKRLNGSAEISDSSYVNSSGLFEFSVEIDSPIKNNMQTQIPFNEGVFVNAIFNIFNHSNLLHTETQNLLIEYSDSEIVNFSYDLSSEGNYTIEIVSEIPDSKFLSSTNDSVLWNFVVGGNNNQSNNQSNNTSGSNNSISELGDFDMDPSNPEEDEDVEFSIEYNSYFINETNGTEELNTTLEVRYYEDGDFLGSDFYYLNSSGTFVFEEAFGEGDWKVKIIASPTNPKWNETITSSKQLTFEIGDCDSDDDSDDKDDYEDFPTDLGINKSSGLEIEEGLIFLSEFEKSEKVGFNYWGFAFSVLLILVFILLLIVLYVLLSQKIA
jgi:hypothetical protein